MRYDKPALSLDHLVDHLSSIGLQGDRSVVTQRLKDVGYYRLSPYWRYFRIPPTSPGSQLREGTTIDDVWRLYTFDRELRLLVMDAIERIEIAVRSRLVHEHVRAQGHDPFSYAEGACVPTGARDPRGHYSRLLDDAKGALAGAVREPDGPHVTEALRHFAKKYGDKHDYPPLWLAAEAFSFGDVVTLYRGSPWGVQKAVARSFKLPEPVFFSWLRTLQVVRNVCAHHGRLWNRVSRITPMVPRHKPIWSEPVLGPNDHPFYVLTILAHFLGVVSDGSGWACRLRELVEVRYPTVPRLPMGMGGGWMEHPVWKARLFDGR
jgi:abortive infection bacteriophage resistance protein